MQFLLCNVSLFVLLLLLFFKFLQCWIDVCHTTVRISYDYTSISSLLSLPPFAPSHPSWSSQSTGLGFLCYTPASCQLPTLHTTVYACWCHFLHPSHSSLPTVCTGPFSTSAEVNLFARNTIYFAEQYPSLLWCSLGVSVSAIHCVSFLNVSCKPLNWIHELLQSYRPSFGKGWSGALKRKLKLKRFSHLKHIDIRWSCGTFSKVKGGE